MLVMFDDCGLVFQSTLPRGERRGVHVNDIAADKFQSTLPRGERLNMRFYPAQLYDFNPRSHEGSD